MTSRMEIDVSDTGASLKRRHSDNKDADNEALTVTDIKIQKQEHDDTSEECVTVAEAKKEKQEMKDTSDKCETVIDTEDQRQEKEETSEECETVIEAEKPKEENEENIKECETLIEIKQQKPENEDISEECAAVIGAEDQRQENEETKEECTNVIDTTTQKLENGVASAECAAVIATEDQKQEQEEARKESQDTRNTEVDTQTDVYEFILNAREPMIQRPSSIKSNVDYQHQIRDTWCTADVTRSLESAQVNVYNTNGNLEKNVIIEQFKGQFGQLLYHGTDELSAKNIIEQGIDLSKSTRCADFSKGNGFYVTADFDSALEWSKRMAQRSGARAAVIAFKFDRGMLYSGTHLSLTVDNDTDRKWWQCIVSHFRRNETSKDVALVLKDVKSIEGPMAEYFQQAIPTPAKGRLITQLCIRDQDLANRFGKLAKIMCVVFISL